MPLRPSATKKSNFIDQVLSPSGIVALLVIIIVISGGIYLYTNRATYMKNFATVGKPTPKPTPTPTKLYPDNGIKGTYNVSANQKSGPRITQVVFDPLNAQKGQPLTLTVTVTNESPVQQVTGELKMDNTSQNLSFARSTKMDTNEVWQATISALPDSVLYNYIFNVSAVAANGTGVGGAAPRSR